MNSGSSIFGYYLKIKLKRGLTKKEQCQRRGKTKKINIILTSMLTEVKQILNDDDDVKQKKSMTGEWV
jgi:hypothetical protein